MILKEGDIITNQDRSWRIQGKIGSESGFGAVFKALDDSGDPVVVKQMLGSGKGDNGMDYEYARATFEREAQILMSHNHPQIVKAHDFFERDEDLLLIMEFINGEDLDQMLIRHMEDNHGLPFDEAEAIAIGVELCKVLHAIHQLPGQVLYRDLKPRNVMWDAKNRIIKLIDFGTARFMDSGAHSTKALGTPGYAPREFYTTTGALSFASDVYTIGATLFELITGEVPEALMTPANFHGQEPRLSQGFRDIVIKSMAQEQKDRYATAESMSLALQKLPLWQGPPAIQGRPYNPYPYLSSLCMQCGAQPRNNQSVFCTQCGGKIHVIMIRVESSDNQPGMDLFLEKGKNLIGRMDVDSQVFPDVDLSRYDPDCYVSRKHCVLERHGNRFMLEALQATNPTTVNGYQISPGRTVEISSDTRMVLANLNLRFIIKPCLGD